MSTARQTALKILYSVEFEGAYSNLKIKSELLKAELNSKDRSLATMLVYGVISRKIALDSVIKKYSSVKINKLSKYVLLILRLGIYQLLFCDKIPESASVNESVKLAGKFAPKSRGFVNGILRSVQRGGYEFKNSAEELSYPENIYNKWCEDFGQEKAESIMMALNQSPKMTVRANYLKNTRDGLIKRLSDEGAFAEADLLYERSVRVSGLDVSKSKAFLDGCFTVQDTSAQLSAYVLSPKKGDTVLDMCASPGGKTTHIAELMENEGRVLAFDIYEHKIKLIEENAKRLGLSIIEAKIMDSSVLDEDLCEKFDCVLADVPCSGLGIIRRKSDIKYNAEFNDKLYDLQGKILDCASKYVKTGGVLVYSTCTLNKYENELRIEKFLKENPNFSAVDISDKINSKTAQSGYVTIFPDEYDADGFFIAKLKKDF